MKKLAVALLALLWAAPAYAQTIIGGGPIGMSASVSIGQYFPNTGVVCDGTIDVTSAITSGMATGSYVPPPNGGAAVTNYASPCKTTFTNITSTPAGVIWSAPGGSRISDNSGNLGPLILFRTTAAPAATSTSGSNNPLTRYVGDLSRSLTIQEVVSGAATLGNTSGVYQYQPGTTPLDVQFYNQNSGYNESTNQSGPGRTGGISIRSGVYQTGLGDVTAFFASGTAGTGNNNATFPLANGATIGFASQINAIANHVYIENNGDNNCVDGGFDIMCFQSVWNANRTVATEALDDSWVSVSYQQSAGSKPVDAVIRTSLAANVGMDFTKTTQPNMIPLTLTMSAGGSGYTAGDKITVPGGTGDASTEVTVDTVDGSGAILTWHISRDGMYTVAPATSVSMSGGTGTGATFAPTYAGNALIAAASGACFYMNASNQGSWPNQILLNKTSLCFPATGIEIGGGQVSNAGSNNVMIGRSSLAQGTDTLTMGLHAYDHGLTGGQVHSDGDFSTNGDAQDGKYLLRCSTASTATCRLTSDGTGTAGSKNCINLSTNTVAAITIDISAIDHTTPGNNESWNAWSGLLTRGSTAASTVLKTNTAPTAITNGTVTGSTIAASADTTNGCLNLTFTPPTGNSDTWRVLAKVQTVEVE